MNLLPAWTPFIDPLPVNFHDAWWILLPPLALAIAMTYKAVRLNRLDAYWKQVGIMTAQIVLGMIALALALHLLVEVYAAFFTARAG